MKYTVVRIKNHGLWVVKIINYGLFAEINMQPNESLVWSNDF